MEQTRVVNLNVPTTLIRELDEIAGRLNRPRAHVILHAVRRSLPTLRSEAQKAYQQREILEREFGEWLA